MSSLKRVRSLLWTYRWWWSIPLAALVLMLLLLLILSDQAGIAPFQYVVN